MKRALLLLILVALPFAFGSTGWEKGGFEAGGVVNAADLPDHADRHEGGGADALDAESLAAPNLTADQILESDGSGGVQAKTIGDVITGSGLPYGTQACNSLQDVFFSEQGGFQCVGTGDAASATWQPFSPIYLIGPRRLHRPTAGSTDCIDFSNFVLDATATCTSSNAQMHVPAAGVIRRLTVTVQANMSGTDGVDYEVYDAGTLIGTLSIPGSNTTVSGGTTFSLTLDESVGASRRLRLKALDGSFCADGTGCLAAGIATLLDVTFHPQAAP